MKKFILFAILTLVFLPLAAVAGISIRNSGTDALGNPFRGLRIKTGSGVFRVGSSTPDYVPSGLSAYFTFDGAFTAATTDSLTVSTTDSITGLLATSTTLASALVKKMFPGGGVIGQAMCARGVNTMRASSTPAVRPTVMTLLVWFKSNMAITNETLISLPWNGPVWGSPFASYLLRLNSPTLIEAGVKPVSQNYTGATFTVPAMNPNTWYHVAMSWDTATTTLYLNGAKYMATTFSSITGGNIAYQAGSALSQPFIIGADTSAAPSGDRLVGCIDDVRLYNRVLSDEEVKTLYYLGR